MTSHTPAGLRLMAAPRRMTTTPTPPKPVPAVPAMRAEDISMTKEQALTLLDILANAFASSTPIAERVDLMTALTNLRTEIASSPDGKPESVTP